MIILAVESTCDETAVAIVRDGREILSDIVVSQMEMHRLYGGVVPEIASRKHLETVYQLTDRALEDAHLSRDDIDAVAASCAPGLIGAVLVGVYFAKSVAFALGVPFIPVPHVRGHIAAGYLSCPDLQPPFAALCVSGGNTLIVDVRNYTDMHLLGASRDDAAGECFDKVARVLGIGYPGGAPMDRLAQGGNDKKYPLPRAHVTDAPLDMSFSGLKTAALNLIHNAQQKNEALDLHDFAASFAAAISDTLIPRMEAATQMLGYQSILCAGGVAANSRIRHDLTALCDRNGWNLYLPSLHLCGDNGAMIAAQAYYEYLSGHIGTSTQNGFATRDIGKSFAYR